MIARLQAQCPLQSGQLSTQVADYLQIFGEVYKFGYESILMYKIEKYQEPKFQAWAITVIGLNWHNWAKFITFDTKVVEI